MKIAKDKWLHFGVCTLIALIVGVLIGLINIYAGALAGLASALSAGIAKEYGDSKAHGNCWSWGDILADVIGAIVGAGIALLLMILL